MMQPSPFAQQVGSWALPLAKGQVCDWISPNSTSEPLGLDVDLSLVHTCLAGPGVGGVSCHPSCFLSGPGWLWGW